MPCGCPAQRAPVVFCNETPVSLRHGPAIKSFGVMIPTPLSYLSWQVARVAVGPMPRPESPTPSGRSGDLKNLALTIEPAANPIRPTLRDGH